MLGVPKYIDLRISNNVHSRGAVEELEFHLVSKEEYVGIPLGKHVQSLCNRALWFRVSVASLAVFPRIWACFFVDLRVFFEDLQVACF